MVFALVPSPHSFSRSDEHWPPTFVSKVSHTKLAIQDITFVSKSIMNSIVVPNYIPGSIVALSSELLSQSSFIFMLTPSYNSR